MHKQYVGSISIKELKNLIDYAEEYSEIKETSINNISIYLDREQGFLTFGFKPTEDSFTTIEAVKINKVLHDELNEA